MSKLTENDKRFEFLVGHIADWGGESIDKIKEDLFPNAYEAMSYTDYGKTEINRYSKVTQDISQLRCQAGKHNGFVITHNAEIHKCAKISYNASNTQCKDFNNYGIITKNGTLEVDDAKNAQFITIPKQLEKCENCCWLPICLLTTCPYSNVRGDKFKCRLENNREIELINDQLIAQYKKGQFISLI